MTNNSKSILENLKQRREAAAANAPVTNNEAVEGTPIIKAKRKPVVPVAEEKVEETVTQPVEETVEEEAVETMTNVQEVEVNQSITEVDPSELPVVSAASIKSNGVPVTQTRKASKPKTEKAYGIVEGGTTTKESFEYLLRDELNNDDRVNSLFKGELSRKDAHSLLGVVYDLIIEVSNKSNIRIGPEINFKLTDIKARPYHNNFTKVDLYNTEQVHSRMSRVVDPGTRLYGMIPENDPDKFYEAETELIGKKRVFKEDDQGNILFTGAVIELNNKK